MNRLAQERSPYLKHAARQPIHWFPWCDEAFDRSRDENKPVFLSSGGVWCHWCHVMAKECFEDQEVAELLNEHFISIKLDRDERPDIDRRYQQAVALMGHAGGWPLSVFLTPDRQPFFGGTYFPPEDGFGRPGFKRVLRSVNDFYRSRTADAAQYGTRVMEALKADAQEPGELTTTVLDRAQDAMLEYFDPQNGGFGSAPKFPLPGALEFLLRRAVIAGDAAAETAVRTTLDRMAQGGVHDQLAGGFHRYSVDDAWFVPHFEKMADDNAWLLRSYLDAYAVFGDERYREVAAGIIRFVREVLSDPSGGFFASQDADVTPDDEGGYFTWSDRELKQVLTIDEYEVVARSLLHERGRLPHDPDKMVLCVARAPQAVADGLGRAVEDVQAVLARGKEKLLAVRRERTMPFIDRTLYTALNGMFITSFLKAFRVLGDAALRDFALASLDRVLRERTVEGTLEHSGGIPALLDDYVYLIEALVAAYEATADRRRLERAEELMGLCLRTFGDREGAFFDTAEDVLGTRLKRVEDIPHPSANAVAILQLIKLWHITGTDAYRATAEKALKAFVRAAEGMSIHAGMYCCALDSWFSMLTLTIEAAPESDLAHAARRLAGRATVLVYGEDRNRIIPCVNGACAEPVSRISDLPAVVSRR
jgi:uncharacterized protein YyaL (SSP411 family)